jgi:Flp pilus assembly protein TadG
VNRQKRKLRRRGAATVEFALCLPLLFLIFFTGYELCRTNMIRHTADNAAYEGARRAIVPGATASDAEDTAVALLNIVGASGATVAVSPTVIQDDTPEVTVTVTVPMDANAWVAPRLMKNKSIVSSFTLARELYEQTFVP